MLTLLFLILTVAVFGKLIIFAFKMTWGLAKLLFTFIFLPVILIGLVVMGLVYIAIPLLIIVGLISLFAGLAE